MARLREFDTDAALDAAMNVFWLKGYEGASLNDLLDAMRIARGSLYKAFSDKRSIYLATLDRYDGAVVDDGVAILRDPRHGSGPERLERLMQAPADALALQGDRRGCFICNAAVERAPKDAEVEAKVKRMLKRLEDAVFANLSDDADTSAWSDTRRRNAARTLINSYMGLRVMAKAGYPVAELRAIARTSMASIGLVAT